MNVNSSDAISSIVGIFSNGGFVTASGLAFSCLALMIWKRTRSTHMLMVKLWTIFNGKIKLSNSVVGNFLKNQSEVLQFRFFTGLHARTMEHVESLVNWGKNNNEDTGAMAACATYFDLEVPCLRDEKDLPRPWFLGVLVVFVVSFVMISVLSLGGMALDRALLKMNQSGTWFALGDIYAKTMTDKPGFKLQECSTDHNKIAATTGFLASDVGLICDAFKANEVPDYVRSTVRLQRIAFGFALAMSLYFGGLAFLGLRSGAAARAMHGRLQARISRVPGQTVELFSA